MKESSWDELGRESLADRCTWIHVPEDGELRFVMLSDRPFCYEAHWVAGGTRVCSGDGCELCARRNRWQRRFVASIWDFDVGARALFEFSDLFAADVARIICGNPSARGFCFRAFRAGRGPRARISASELLGGEQLLRDTFGIGLGGSEIPAAQGIQQFIKSVDFREKGVQNGARDLAPSGELGL